MMRDVDPEARAIVVAFAWGVFTGALAASLNYVVGRMARR